MSGKRRSSMTKRNKFSVLRLTFTAPSKISTLLDVKPMVLDSRTRNFDQKFLDYRVVLLRTTLLHHPFNITKATPCNLQSRNNSCHHFATSQDLKS